MTEKVDWISKQIELIEGRMYDHWGESSADYEYLDLELKVLLIEVIRKLTEVIKEK